MRPLVLCYHAVSDGWQHLLAVTPDDFERQLRLVLDEGYRPATAHEVARGEGKLVHVTFDDAFTSVWNALPVLERLGFPATVFVCPGFAGDGGLLDIPELAQEAERHPHELQTMDWSELRELAGRPGIEIGAHSVTHPHLVGLSEGALSREIGESRRRIEDELDRGCSLFAYPYGEHDERVRRSVRAAGFVASFGLQPRASTWRDPLQLPRVGIWRGEGERAVRFKISPLGRSLPVSLLRRARDRLA